MNYVFFLGSHPTLSAAESFAVLAAEGHSPQLIAAHQHFMIVEIEGELPDGWLKAIGGIDRVGTITSDMGDQVEAGQVLEALAPLARKSTIGLSALEFSLPSLKRLGNDMKKMARGQDKKIRFILPGRGTQLNAGQILQYKLHQKPNRELTLLPYRSGFALVETVWWQDIQAYELRDTQRPARSGRIGMLPPKLAQMLLNLAVSHLPKRETPTILDPFCGVGTILQEGWLAGYRMIGSDLAVDMIESSRDNLQWLAEHFSPAPDIEPNLFQHDCRQPFVAEMRGTIDAIVTEPHLGPALRAPLSAQEMGQAFDELGTLYLSFFKQAKAVLKRNGVILFVLPAFRRSRRDKQHFDLFPDGFLDEIKKLGYSALQLVPEEIEQEYPAGERETLLYARPDALVGRELTLWKKMD